MEQHSYEIEAEVERHHWWFRGRRQILSRLLAAGPELPAGARVLDVGCGTGANLPVLVGRGRLVVGVDLAALPLGLGRRGPTKRLRGDAARLPFADGTFDLVTALDVLEHLDDDRGAARELFRVLKPGGRLVIFVPALQLLWGLQDEASHHRRRYHRPELADLAQSAGFVVERLTFFNTLLFLPILGARLAMRLHRPRTLRSENELGGPVTNTVLGAIFAAEAPLLDRVDLPVGVSLACLAHRPPG